MGELGIGIVMVRALDVLWGKSNANGAMNLLSQHLLDTAAVAELIWDYYLAPAVRVKLDAHCRGRGRELFALLCGLHDVGKASPAFQAKAPEFAPRLSEAGLPLSLTTREQQSWHHTLAGAVVVRRLLGRAGWSDDSVAWVWPLVAGHHGVVPPEGKLRPSRLSKVQGSGPWLQAQDELVDLVTTALGVDLAALEPATVPRRAEQLALLGGVIMADWIASNADNFGGIDDSQRVSLEEARRRARKAWDKLRLRGGWNPAELSAHPDLIRYRFGTAARPVQSLVVELAEQLPAAGLLIVEAPTGEGKTEAALAAVEVLARRFGADGVFIGMPTQATSDPMYTRVRKWVRALAPGSPVGLLHGKRRFNKDWHALTHGDAGNYSGIDEYGCEDEFNGPCQSEEAPAEWFHGRKLGLLMSIVVGTVDHLLYAGTRTRHVMLRHLGLAGRVVVLDEVHAHDIFMSQFTMEALRWLADAGVPVVLLSATLPPTQRAALARAYLQGALDRRDVDVELPPVGYPGVLAVSAVDGQPVIEARGTSSWRPSNQVAVEILDESPDSGPQQVVDLLVEALGEGGCALVVHNTVRRAQETYLAAREAFGDDAVLLHARLAMGTRVERTERVLDQLGPDGERRPQRLVVVATQLAEQSFDVDADLLVTDLAPIDLLLQRAGRLHRHDRVSRPRRVAQPRVVVTGLSRRDDAPPWLPPGSTAVYGDHLLLRSAALVMSTDSWSLPAEVPELVTLGYGDDPITPASWAEAVAAARLAWQEDQRVRVAKASDFLLAGRGKFGEMTLAGLHDRHSGELPDEEAATSAVRDGDPSVEVVLVRHDGRQYLTLDGRPMGPTGAAVSDEVVLQQVLDSTVRLPASTDLTAVVERELRPLPGWSGDAWLARTRALLLDENLSAELEASRYARHCFTYDRDLGLLHERSRQ